MKHIDYKTLSKRIALMIAFAFASVLFYSCIRGVIYMIDSNRTHKELEDIKTLIDFDDDTYDGGGIIDEAKDPNRDYTSSDVDNSELYFDYLNTNPLNVDISKLKELNSDSVAWLKVNGTYVSYPVVQTINNEYYLSHSFDKTTNGAGWVFADYRNNWNTLDKNTVIYAHGRFDKTMFGSLKNIFTSTWQSDSKNFLINLSTENENTLWQIFSIYHIPTTTDYIKIQFSNDDEFLKFTRTIQERSTFDFHTSISADDKILTLSTCLNNEDKIVVHAKLISSETKF